MISTSENQVIYLGDGVKWEWDLTFKILQKEDLHLIRVAADGTEQEVTSDFYVHMDTHIVDYPGYAPGAEIPEAARPLKLQAGEKLVLYRDVEIVQEADMPDQWPFDVIEDALDKSCIIDQQLQGQLDRTLKINRSAWTSGFDGTIPIAPGKSLRFSEDGKRFEATDDPTVATVAAESSAAAAAASAASAAASAASAAASAANVSSFYPRIEAINENVTRIGETVSYNAEQTAINKNLSEQYRNQANTSATLAEGFSAAAGVSAAEAKASETSLAGVKEKLNELVNVANDGTWQYDENLNIEPITRPFDNKYWKLNADGTLSPVDIGAELVDYVDSKTDNKVNWSQVTDTALSVPPVLQHNTIPNAFAVNQALTNKQDALTAGNNIKIANGTISLADDLANSIEVKVDNLDVNCDGADNVWGHPLVIKDKNNGWFAQLKAENHTWNKANYIGFSLSNKNGSEGALGLNVKQDGSAYAVAPTPKAEANGGEVVTAEWANEKLSVQSGEIVKLQNSKIDDVTINGTSVVTDKVANIPWATTNSAGVVRLLDSYGISVYDNARIGIAQASVTEFDGRSNLKPITMRSFDLAVKKALCTAGTTEGNVLQKPLIWNEQEKQNARERLGVAIVTLTQAEYDALEVKSADTTYLVLESD